MNFLDLKKFINGMVDIRNNGGHKKMRVMMMIRLYSFIQFVSREARRNGILPFVILEHLTMYLIIGYTRLSQPLWIC